jgi:predicted nucleotidyltransferase/HEPN domain-containing protein
MRSTLEHLPEGKREELRRLAETIRGMCNDVEMILLYGSYARGDYKEEKDLDPERASGDASDYDILVVTTEKDTVRNGQLWGKVDKALQALGLSAWPRVIVHDRWYLAKVLGQKHYFFNDLFVEGVALYDSGVFAPKIREKLTPAERREAAQEHFEHWFVKSRVCYEDFQSNFDKAPRGREYLNKAAFELQQAAECAYKALLLVYTNYTPYNHHLDWFDTAIRDVVPDLPNFFPRETKEAEERFKNFDRAYIGARYDTKYRISEADLRYFSERVELLMSETESRCKAFLEKLPGSFPAND